MCQERGEGSTRTKKGTQVKFPLGFPSLQNPFERIYLHNSSKEAIGVPFVSFRIILAVFVLPAVPIFIIYKIGELSIKMIHIR